MQCNNVVCRMVQCQNCDPILWSLPTSIVFHASQAPCKSLSPFVFSESYLQKLQSCTPIFQDGALICSQVRNRVVVNWYILKKNISSILVFITIKFLVRLLCSVLKLTLNCIRWGGSISGESEVIPSFLLLPGSLWPRVVVPAMGEIDPFVII